MRAPAGRLAGLSGAAAGAGSPMRLLRRKGSGETTRAQAEPSHLQRLVREAQATFERGRQASRADIERVRGLLAAVPLHELGLEERAAAADAEQPAGEGASSRGLFRRLGFGGVSQARQPSALITYLHICETRDFGLGIFCLPRGTQLPLHDHPQMTVFSRVLYGTLQVEAFDWQQPPCGALRLGEARPAKPALSRRLRASEPPVVLFPRAGGNIHCFSAVSSCAVLDLLAPPYDLQSADRGCSYYAVEPDSEVEGLRLKRVGSPRPYNVTNGTYEGIPVE